MSGKRFKLFEVADGNEVLVERVSDDENGEAIITSFYDSDGTKVELKGGYGNDEEKADYFFEKWNQETTQTHYSTIEGMTKS